MNRPCRKPSPTASDYRDILPYGTYPAYSNRAAAQALTGAPNRKARRQGGRRKLTAIARPSGSNTGSKPSRVVPSFRISPLLPVYPNRNPRFALAPLAPRASASSFQYAPPTLSRIVLHGLGKRFHASQTNPATFSAEIGKRALQTRRAIV